MKKTALIGFGKWGKIIKPKIEEASQLCGVYRSKDNYLDKLTDLDWVVVATPNESHYEIVKKCLELKLNVFCEKPLTENYKKSLDLFDIAKKNKKKLYVNDVENFKNLKINYSNKKNLVCRKKSGGGEIKDLLFRLAYHDFYLIYKYASGKKVHNIKLLEKENYLSFSLYFDEVPFEFLYNVNSSEKTHTINDTNFVSQKDVLYKMFKTVLNEEFSFNYNQQITLFTNKLIDLLKKNFNF